MTRGVGEFLVGLNCGPLAVIGSYYVQTQIVSWEPIIASIPLGVLVLAIVWVNEIPDYLADSKAGKRTLVTRLGRKKAADVYGILIFFVYAFVLLSVFLSLMPILTLISFLTVPLAVKAVKLARKNYNDPPALIPANATTVLVHLFTGILLCASYVISYYVVL